MLILSYPVYIHDWRNKRLLLKSLRSVKSADRCQIHLVINGSSYPNLPRELQRNFSAIVVYNRVNGVAAAWAEAIKYALGFADDDVLILANQDVEFYSDSLDSLCEEANHHEFVCGTPPRPQDSFSLWGGNIATFRRFAKCDVDIQNRGYPDRQFSPAYFEDNDLDYRFKLSGMTRTRCEARYKHAGSSVIRFNHKAREANKKTFEENRLRYIAKWGGEPGHEKFRVPYNGQTKI